MSDPNQVSVKELASKLKVSDALLKKFIKDFNITPIQEKKLLYVTHESAEILKEIIRLRDAGKKNIEIKKLFEEAQKAQKQEEEQAQQQEQIEELPASTNVVEEPSHIEATTNTEATLQVEAAKPQAHNPEIAEEYYNEYLAEQISENEEVVSLAMQQAELGDEEEAPATAQAKFNDNHIEEEAPEEEDDDEREESHSAGGKRRRRQFSFRFIQRQIANDMKRVDYIRHKLKRGKLSTLESRSLEDSLDKRSHLLSGWTHLLRWVKN